MTKINKIKAIVSRRYQEDQEIFFRLGELRWAYRENDPIKNLIDKLYSIFSTHKRVPLKLSIELTPQDTLISSYPIILFDLGYKLTDPSNEKLLTFVKM